MPRKTGESWARRPSRLGKTTNAAEGRAAAVAIDHSATRPAAEPDAAVAVADNLPLLRRRDEDAS
jgi:hypothetical protein